MRIGFIVNDITTETASYTTTHLAWNALKSGHDVIYLSVEDLAYHSDGSVGGHARQIAAKKFRSVDSFLEELNKTEQTSIKASALDVLMLRNDPSADIESRPWAQNTGIIFGQMAAKQGVIVLNDPFSLANAINKMYFQHFPEQVRPKAIITRNVEDVKKFYEEVKHRMVLKPLQGSGGRNVFLVSEKEAMNINQMFEAISRDGYVIAQEYLPAAKDGDIRLFLMNGKPIIVDGEIGALHRHQKQGEIRSNIHKGGKASKANVPEKALQLAELVMPKLVEDGMFLVGLDIVGDKLMEVNVFSPGGLVNASSLCNVNFFTPVIDAIEKKVHYKKTYKESMENVRIASMM